MNKENKREATLEQLERQYKVNNIVGKIFGILMILFGISMIIYLLFDIKKGVSSQSIMMFLILFVLLLVCALFYVKTGGIEDKLCQKIHNQQRKSELTEIKQKVEEGTWLKNYTVGCPNNSIIAQILEKDMEKAVFQKIEGGTMVFDIYFKTKFRTVTVKIPIEEMIPHIKMQTIDSILNDIIMDVRVHFLGKDSTKLTFVGKDFSISMENMTDDELLEIFSERK